MSQTRKVDGWVFFLVLVVSIVLTIQIAERLHNDGYRDGYMAAMAVRLDELITAHIDSVAAVAGRRRVDSIIECRRRVGPMRSC